MNRGQFSIDFFLVLSIIVAFFVLLYAVAIGEVGKARLVDSAVLSKSAVDGVASTIEFVALGGNYTSITREVFVPKEAACFFYNDAARKVFCVLSSQYVTGGKNRVESRTLLVSPPVRFDCGSSPTPGGGTGIVEPGWYDVNVTYVTASTVGQHVSVKCVKVS